MTLLTPTTAIALCLFVPAFTIIYRLFYEPLHEVNGPFLARFSRIWYFLSILSGKHEKDAISLHRTYGKVVRIAPNQYSVDDPEAMKMIYGHGSNFTKAEFYKAFDQPHSPNIFSGRDNKMHTRDRKRLQKYYNMSVMTSYEGYVDNCVSLLCRKFDEFAKNGESINLAWWLQCFAFDVIGEITYSGRFGFLDHGRDVDGLIESVQENSKYSSLVGVFPEFVRAMFLLNSFLFQLGLRSDLANIYLRKWAMERWNSRKSQRTEKVEGHEGEHTSNQDAEGTPKDFLTKFIEANEADPEAFDLRDAMNGVGGNINAGSDTTSIMLSAIFYYLSRNPDALHKLRAEISRHEKAGTASKPITFKETLGMEYLQAVIKEAMRVNPALGLILPRVVPAGGATIGGHYFPAGSVVGINQWIAHYNTDVYGADASSFRPERWLKSCNDEATLARMEHYYLPFGAGARSCIGRNVSLLEIQKLVPEIVRKFDFELSEDVLENGVETENIFFVVPRNMVAKVKERGDD